MFSFFKKKKEPKKIKLDNIVLRKNDISILILDERWNSIFKNSEKSNEVKQSEKKLKELLKEQAKSLGEAKQIAVTKKRCLDKIIQLTPLVYDKGDEASKSQMMECEKEVNRINERLKILEAEIEEFPDRIREANLELLENTVNSVYLTMRENQVRLKELKTLIDKTKETLWEYYEERSKLSKYDSGIYSYFHDLLGADELEELDKEFLGKITSNGK